MRSRLPKRSAVVQVVLRGIALACSVATVCVALYASVRHDYAKEMIGAYVAACWTILLDATEITILSNRRQSLKSPGPGLRGFIELLTLVLCAATPVLVEASYRGITFECGGRPADERLAAERYRNRVEGAATLAFALQWIVGALHFIFICFACVDCCRGR